MFEAKTLQVRVHVAVSPPHPVTYLVVAYVCTWNRADRSEKVPSSHFGLVASGVRNAARLYSCRWVHGERHRLGADRYNYREGSRT